MMVAVAAAALVENKIIRDKLSRMKMGENGSFENVYKVEY